MSRNLSVGMAAHLAGNAHSRAFMLRLDLADGAVQCFTDHDQNLDFDIDGLGVETFHAHRGIRISNIESNAGLGAGNFEAAGPVTAFVPLPALLGRRYSRAVARLFQVNHANLTDGHIPISKGKAYARVEGGTFVFAVRDARDGYNQTIGSVITNMCQADYGDAKCKKAVESVIGTVAVSTDRMRFDVDYAGDFADDYFNLGTVFGLTGANAGVTIEIFDWSSSGGIELFRQLPAIAEIGDTFSVRRGCGKTRPDCMARDNILNMRACPEVPGRKALMPAVPGATGADG